MTPSRTRQTGFTLIELIITIVVIGVMVMGIAGFIELGTKGYADTVDRQQLQNQARFVIEKLTREIRHAVPNSFTPTQECLSFYPIDYAGAYAALPVAGATSSEFKFIIVSNKGVSASALSDKRLVINPNSPNDLEGDTNQSISLNGVTEEGGVFNIDDPDFNQNTVINSVANRLYIYSDQVSYYVKDSKLKRSKEHADCNEIQSNDSGIQVGEDLTSQSSFADTDGDSSDSLSRSGLVPIKLFFKKNNEVTNYDTDVQVLNVP